MPANTPTYGFPYPIGTDLIADGDNAIQALALAIEGRFKTATYWNAVRGGAAVNMPAAGVWGTAVAVACNGAPIGAKLLAIARPEWANGATPNNLSSRFNALVGCTDADPLRAYAVSAAAGYFAGLVHLTVLTVTAANPTVSFEAMAAQAGGAACQLNPGSHLVVLRLI